MKMKSIKMKEGIIMDKEEFEKELTRYLGKHPKMHIDDTSTYDMLINEYMSTCKCTNDSDKEIFPYPANK